MLKTRACDGCGTTVNSTIARYCGRCGDSLPRIEPEPETAPPPDLPPTDSTASDADRPWALIVGIGAALLGLAAGLALATQQPDEAAWPGELVVRDAARIAEEIYQSGEPLLLPSVEDARIAVVAVHLDDPMSVQLYGDVMAVVTERLGLMAIRLVDPHMSEATEWCSSSGWFETPTGGSSMFNGLGEWMGGPAPRGLDRYASRVDDDGQLIIDFDAFAAGPQRFEHLEGREVWIDSATGVRIWDRSRVEGSLPFGEPRGPHCND